MPGLDVARVLRNTRDLLNSGGRHWVKGDLRIEINKDVIRHRDAGDYDNRSISPKAQVGDVGFCLWGGLKEVADSHELQIEAMEALVQIIDPLAYENYMYYRDECESQYDAEYNYNIDYNDGYRQLYPTFNVYWGELLEEREETLGDIIATWNDADTRMWNEVRDSLDRAAAKCKKVNVVTT